MSELPKGIEFIEGLLGWIQQRPEMYALLAGELDGILNYLHVAWAAVKDRMSDLDAALDIAGRTARGLLRDDECSRRVNREDEVTRRVLAFWAKVDEVLGVKRYP